MKAKLIILFLFVGLFGYSQSTTISNAGNSIDILYGVENVKSMEKDVLSIQTDGTNQIWFKESGIRTWTVYYDQVVLPTSTDIADLMTTIAGYLASAGYIVADGFVLDGDTITNWFIYDSSLYILENAAARVDIEAYGQLWVKDGTPNTLWYTDDAGTDVQLGAASGVTGSGTDGFVSSWNGTGSVLEDSPMQTNGTQMAIGYAAAAGATLAINGSLVLSSINNRSANTANGIFVKPDNGIGSNFAGAFCADYIPFTAAGDSKMLNSASTGDIIFYSSHGVDGAENESLRINQDSDVTITGTLLVTGEINDTDAVTGDQTFTDVVPIGYILEYIIFEETAGNTATLDLGTTAGASDIFSQQVITASTFTTVVINKFFSASAATTAYLSDDGAGTWNSASVNVTFVLKKIF